MKREHKVVWVYPSKNTNRFSVRPVEKYMSLCPPYHSKPNFYLESLSKPRPSHCYGNQVVGQNIVAKFVKESMIEVGIEGFKVNHSLCQTGGTRLFQVGVDCKLVKEASEHKSDDVDAYQIKSADQRKMMSGIISNSPPSTVSVNPVESVEPCENQEQNEEKAEKVALPKSCSCEGVINLSDIIKSIIKESSKKG